MCMMTQKGIFSWRKKVSNLPKERVYYTIMKKSNLSSRLFLMAMTVAGVALTAPAAVSIRGSNGAFTLEVDGQPFFIRGAGGGGDKALLKSLGGNSFRTWGAGDIEKQLAEARKHGLMVMCGFWLGHLEHGFDYTNKRALEETEAEVLSIVERVKSDPNLLVYTLGNEMELNNPHRPEMWTFINHLAQEVKKRDPNHPVGTVIAEIPTQNTDELKQYCPDLDFVGINSYGGCASLAARWRQAGMKIPFIVTEFGTRGSWEGPKDAKGTPLEPNSTKKGDMFRLAYEGSIEIEQGKMCLGSYGFTWGWKVEATPTWHGMLLPDGSLLAAVEEVQKKWGVTRVVNSCPRIGDIKVSTIAPSDNTLTASVQGTDPDGDALKWQWALLSDTGDYDTIGTGLAMPEGWEEAIVAGQGTPNVTVKLPGGGIYILYAYCFDGKGHAAYANIPVYGSGAEPKRVLKPRDMPCKVYGDGVEPFWYPSGYMGQVLALKVEENCRENPHRGETCMKISYLDHYGWAGIFWQNPPNDWGEKTGGANLSKADTLVFWARGEKGGEKVSFWMGGLKGKKFSDTASAKLGEVVLKKEWTRYRIALDGQDLSCIKSGFGFNLANEGDPFTFYLDDISYVTEE